MLTVMTADADPRPGLIDRWRLRMRAGRTSLRASLQAGASALGRGLIRIGRQLVPHPGATGDDLAHWTEAVCGTGPMVPVAGAGWIADEDHRRLEQALVALQAKVEGYRKAAEATKASNAAKSRFLALASHELRTPLNGILGMAELLGRTSLSPEQTAYVNAVSMSGTALLSLVDDVLDIGKIEAGRMVLQPKPVLLETLIEEVVELLAPRAQAKGLELAAHVGQQVPTRILADGQQLARILMNLAGNAIKFTESGGVAIEVLATPRAADRVHITMLVRDTGIGIAPADRSRIFGDYEQVDQGPSRRYGGTGLGLSISRSIARAMGGDIDLSHQSGAGSTFRFAADFATLEESAVARPPLVGHRVLIVAGRSIEPPLLLRRLFDLGASVELVTSREAAEDVLATRQGFDVMLIDHASTNDAGELLSALPEPRPAAAVLIAPADRGALAPLRQAGFIAHLVKPVRTLSLVRVITALASGQSLDDPPVPDVGTEAMPIRRLDVLLADDNDVNALLGRSIVTSLGYAVAVIGNGAEAVAAVRKRLDDGNPHNVILMDLHMPVLDGFAAIAAIRQLERRTGQRALILALSADTTGEAHAQAMAAGADGLLSKPIDSAALAAALQTFQIDGESTYVEAGQILSSKL